MICYKDKTFCVQQDYCQTQECDRRLTDKDKEYLSENIIGISIADFSQVCNKYVPISVKELNDKID